MTLEAGTKYLVLSALSTGFLVYGIAWIFGATGQTNLQQIGDVLPNPATDRNAVLLGMVLVLVALGFKIAAVPFQIWVPDVYQGAPTPVTAYLSVGSKAAGFVVLLRVLQPLMNLPQTQRLMFVIALLTLIYGNLAALPQTNMKRLLAYSSIAHAGYLLIGVVCFDVRAISFYLVAYLLMTLLSFTVLIIVAQQTGEEISNFDGLGMRSPFLAFAMLIGMVSLAGIPFTAGFLGKFFIFYAAIAQRQLALVVVGVITVACGFYYYLKVIRAMYWQSAATVYKIPVSALSRFAMSALILAIIALGIYPQPILRALNPPAPVTAAGRSLGHQAAARCLSDFTRQDPIRCEVFLSSDSFNPCVSVDSGVLTHARRLASRQDVTAATAWTKSFKKCETFTNFSVERSAQTMIICR